MEVIISKSADRTGIHIVGWGNNQTYFDAG